MSRYKRLSKMIGLIVVKKKIWVIVPFIFMIPLLGWGYFLAKTEYTKIVNEKNSHSFLGFSTFISSLGLSWRLL